MPLLLRGVSHYSVYVVVGFLYASVLLALLWVKRCQLVYGLSISYLRFLPFRWLMRNPNLT